MRIVVVHPEKVGRAEPGEGRERGGGGRLGLTLFDGSSRRNPGSEVIVVDPESLIEAVTPRQHHGRNHAGPQDERGLDEATTLRHGVFHGNPK